MKSQVVIDTRKCISRANLKYEIIEAVKQKADIIISNTFLAEMEEVLGMDDTVDFNALDCWNHAILENTEYEFYLDMEYGIAKLIYRFEIEEVEEDD